MKPALLHSYATNLSRIAAEEDLRLVGVVAAGTASMKKEAHRRYLRELESQAQGRERARKATLADLAGMGIAVERV